VLVFLRTSNLKNCSMITVQLASIMLQTLSEVGLFDC
jgi:hypothetical protein